MATVDIGNESYPSFIDADAADTFLGGDISRADGWFAATPDQRARALASATRLLLTIPWAAPAPTPAVSPAIVKQVTAMLAADLLAKPELFADASGSSNVKSVKAGSASVEFFRPVVGGPPIPSLLWRMLAAAGLVSGPVTSDKGIAGAIVTGLAGGRRPLLGRYPGEYLTAARDHD